MKSEFKDKTISVDDLQETTDYFEMIKSHNEHLSDVDAMLWDGVNGDDAALAHRAIEEGADVRSKADPFFEDNSKRFPARQITALEYAGMAAAKNVLWYLRDVRGEPVHVPTTPKRDLLRYNEEWGPDGHPVLSPDH